MDTFEARIGEGPGHVEGQQQQEVVHTTKHSQLPAREAERIRSLKQRTNNDI